MFNLVGDCKITKLHKVSPKMTVGTAYTSHKVGDEFQTTFIDVKFVGESLKQLAKDKVQDKDKITIESGVIKNETHEHNGKKYSKLVLTVFKARKWVESDIKPTSDKDQPF